MNFSGQVLWKRSVIGVCARAIIGKPRVVAPAAALEARKRRRICFFGTLSTFSSRVILVSVLAERYVHDLSGNRLVVVYAFSVWTLLPVTKPALFAKMFGLRYTARM